jgi:hypothetical protein
MKREIVVLRVIGPMPGHRSRAFCAAFNDADGNGRFHQEVNQPAPGP